MRKYIEFGLGNTWLVRTEFEDESGQEWEVRGIVGPIAWQSCYVRLWLGKSVYILDSREGFKRQSKKKKRFKLVFGLVCQAEEGKEKI